MVYDLIVIGGGPAGYLAAERAGQAGLNTLLIEKRFLGGVCLNEGCIPSKALLYCAKAYDYAKHGKQYGVFADNVRFDHGIVIDRKNNVVKSLVAGVRSKLKKSSVTVVEGFGEIKGRNGDGFTVEVKSLKEHVNGQSSKADSPGTKAGGLEPGTGSGADTGPEYTEKREYTTKGLLIATGSEPLVPPIPGVKEGLERGTVLTNREILDLKELPGSLVIIGGGVIGLEMASYFSSAGSKVTVVEMLDHIGGSLDSEISGLLLKEYQKKGVEFRLGSKVTEVRGSTVVYESDGKTERLNADKILMSIGRRPVTAGIGLENIGVEIERGRIKTDCFGRTNIPGVYAAGDVNGTSMLAHTAYREAEVCVNHMLGRKDVMRYHAVPSVIYTNPEVASVGETEETARQKGLDFEAVTISMKYSGRYLAEENGSGICKLLVDRKYKKLIGVHMMGNYSSEIIYGAAMMIETEMRIEDIKEIVFPHPTVSEVIREGIFEFKI